MKKKTFLLVFGVCNKVKLKVTCSAKEAITYELNRSYCGNVRYNTHLYYLVVQAGFYSDMVECWLQV